MYVFNVILQTQIMMSKIGQKRNNLATNSWHMELLIVVYSITPIC
jgi:hypothetical protein